MTPPLRWVFLLASVGCAASVPAFLTDDACALLCHPRAKASPEGVCELQRAQSGSVLDQARIIAGECLQLCDRQLPFSVEANCYALRSFLVNFRGCYCSSVKRVAFTSARIVSLVDELAKDMVSAMTPLPLGRRVMCALHAALFREDDGAEEFNLGVDCQLDDQSTRNEEDKKSGQRDDEDDAERSSMRLKGRGTRQLESERSLTTAKSDSPEDSIDWELWCMQQCNSGHGGNACRCDIIP